MITVVVGKEIEKIKGDFESYLNGLNMVGEISYSQYSELYDEGTKQIQKAYELGKSELEKENAELEKACDETQKLLDKQIEATYKLDKENAELRKVAEFQQSSNMSRHFENKKLKEGLAIGSTFNKSLNSMNKNLEEEMDKYRNMVFDKDDQLTKAKELLKEFVHHYKAKTIYIENMKDLLEQAEQFLSEVEK